MTATYWEIGRRIVTEEQRGRRRADYGEALIRSLSADLTAQFGRAFSATNLVLMRQFYSTFGPADQPLEPPPETASPIHQTLSDEFIAPNAPGSAGATAALESRQPSLPLTWSHYVRLLQVKNDHARRFYEAGSLRRLASAVGYRPMAYDGLLKAGQGITTMEEILRVANA